MPLLFVNKRLHRCIRPRCFGLARKRVHKVKSFFCLDNSNMDVISDPSLVEATKRSSAITEGTNQMVPFYPKSIVEYTMRTLSSDVKQVSIPKYWDGEAAERVVTLL